MKSITMTDAALLQSDVDVCVIKVTADDEHCFVLVDGYALIVGLPNGQWCSFNQEQNPPLFKDFTSNTGVLYCLDEKGKVWACGTGSGAQWITWHQDQNPPAFFAMASNGGTLYCLDEKGKVWACGTGSGAQWITWHQDQATPPAFIQITCNNDRVFAIDEQGKVWVCGTGSGAQWYQHQNSPAFIQIACNNNQVFATDVTGTIYAHDIFKSGGYMINCPTKIPKTNQLTLQELITAISKYAPIIKFYGKDRMPAEEFNMSSVEWFLSNCKLRDNITKTLSSVNIDTLPTGDHDDGHYSLILKDSAKGGDLSTAKAYVNALYKTLCTDIQFWLFYPYNGPATIVTPFNGIFNASPCGEHYGDWECVVVRISNDTQTPLGVWVSQHGGGQYIEWRDLQLAGKSGTQPVIFASRHGHANYPNTGENLTYVISRNDTNDRGASLDCSTFYQIIHANWDIGVITPSWVNFPYGWGNPWSVSYDDVFKLVHNRLRDQGCLPNTSASALILAELALVVKFSLPGNAPSGPKQHITSWKGEDF